MVRESANHIRGKSWKHWGCLAKQRQHWRQSQEKQGRNFSLTNVHQGPFHPGDLTKTSKSKTKWNKSCNKTHPLKLVPMPLFSASQTKEFQVLWLSLLSWLSIFRGCINVGHFGHVSGLREFQMNGSWIGGLCGTAVRVESSVNYCLSINSGMTGLGKDFLPTSNSRVQEA